MTFGSHFRNDESAKQPAPITSCLGAGGESAFIISEMRLKPGRYITHANATRAKGRTTVERDLTIVIVVGVVVIFLLAIIVARFRRWPEGRKRALRGRKREKLRFK